VAVFVSNWRVETPTFYTATKELIILIWLFAPAPYRDYRMLTHWQRPLDSSLRLQVVTTMLKRSLSVSVGGVFSAWLRGRILHGYFSLFSHDLI